MRHTAVLIWEMETTHAKSFWSAMALGQDVFSAGNARARRWAAVEVQAENVMEVSHVLSTGRSRGATAYGTYLRDGRKTPIERERAKLSDEEEVAVPLKRPPNGIYRVWSRTRAHGYSSACLLAGQLPFNR